MKLWKVLLPLLVLGCSLWCSCPVLAAESPAETLAEESGSAELTEQLDWDIQSVLEQLGLSFTDVGGAGESLPSPASGRCFPRICRDVSAVRLPCWEGC